MHKFQDAEPEWIPISLGEAGLLRLKGPEGNLDLVACYFPTGNQAEEEALPQQRIILQGKIASHIRDGHDTLTLLGGDFNYVTASEDRWSKDSGKWSGDKDHREAIHFSKIFNDGVAFE